MDRFHPSESWYNQVVEEEWKKHKLDLNTHAPVSKGEATSDISMAKDDDLHQGDSDIVVEEERIEEDMETGVSPSPAAPTPPGVTPMAQGLEVGDGLQESQSSDDENPLQDLDVDKDELLGVVADVSIPRGHSDDSIALRVPPDEDTL